MKSPTHSRPTESSGIKMNDVLYVLFKHKWKILGVSLLGFGAAGALAYQNSQAPLYETRAKLLVRYVVERRDADQEILASSKAVTDTELQILTSSDLAVDTAAKIGPEKLLPGRTIPPTPVEAAGKVTGGFEVLTQSGSNVIQLCYRDRDPQRAVVVLDQLIKSYFAKHLEIHRSNEAYKLVTTQSDQARAALREITEEINKLKGQSGVLSIESTIGEFESRRQVARGSLLAAQTALAEQRAKVESLEKSSAARPIEDKKTVDAATKRNQDMQRRQMAGAIAEYQDIGARLTLLRQERNQLLLRRPSNDPMVVALDRQISVAQRRGVELDEQFPELAGRVETTGGPAIAPVGSLEDERALQTALEARVTNLASQAKTIDGEAEGLSALGAKLDGLERRRLSEEEKIRLYQPSVEKARSGEASDPSKIPNISIVQSPSAPIKAVDPMAMKIMLGLAGSGLALGVGFAFLKEWVIDRRISRPTDIQTRLHLPLMLSIPYIRSKDELAKLIGETGSDAAEGKPSSSPPAVVLKENGKRTHKAAEHFIAPYAGAIHDRILFNFAVNDIHHKPKLVGVAGLSEGAGVSTIAAGLAKAFSDEGDRKVLLVDLNPPRSDKTTGSPSDSLRRALDVSKGEHFRESPRNLYLASAPGRRNGHAGALAAVTLHEIMPKLEASDFDYIVFDMPPVHPTSPTPAMAGFMDKVLLVLDAQKTSREDLSWAYSELEKGRADVSCIYNKARSHAPRWVEGVA